MNGDYLQELFLAFLWFSARWAAVIVVLWLGLRLSKAKRLETRYLVCQLGLAGGLLIACLPVFWGPEKALPQQPSTAAMTSITQIEEIPAWLPGAREPSPRRSPAKPEDLPPGQVNASASNKAAAENETPAAFPAAIPDPAQPSLPSSPSETAATRANESTSLSLASLSLRVLRVVWILGVLLSLLRLLIGWCWLVRLRWASRPASGAATSLFNRCCSELGISQRIELLVHPQVSVPALIGQLRPAIALPVDWDELPAPSRRAALLHELTHFANHDQWAKLRDEIVRAVFFFHPFVRWLLNVLEGCREERCDAAVVTQGISPSELAQVLFDFARSNSESLRTRLLANSFFNQLTVKDRINHLLEKDFMNSTTRLSRGGRVTLVIGLFGLVMAIGGFGLRSPSVHAESETKPAPVVTSNAVGAILDPAAPAAPIATGRVVDEQDHPVAGAHVLLYRDMSSVKPALTQTDAQGNFMFASLPGDRLNGWALWLVAAKAGFAPATHYVTEEPGLTLKLTKPATVSGSIRDRLGKPIADARVLFGIVQQSHSGGRWHYVDETAIRGTPIEPFLIGRTDSGGEFKIASAPADAKVSFQVSAPGHASLDTVYNPSLRWYLANPTTPPAVLKLGPEGRIDGKVITKVAGLSLAGHTVFATGRAGEYKRKTTDSGGRFEFAGLEPGTYDLWIDLSDPKIGAVRSQIGLNVEVGKTAQAELQIVPGTLVEGNVIAATTGMPVTDAGMSLQSPALPNRAFRLHEVLCDANGHYAVRLAAGDYAFILRNPGKGFVQPPGYRPSNIKITEGLAAVEGPTVRVVPATPRVALKGRVIDAAGKPIEGAKIIGLCKGGACTALSQQVVSDEFGHFELAQGPEGPFTVGTATSLQVELAGDKTFESHIMTVAGLAEVQLPTFVKTFVPGLQDVKPNDLEGLVVDEDQRPLEGVHVHAWDWVDKPENQVVTGKDGRFKIVDCANVGRVEVRFRKTGYSPVVLVQQKTGVRNLIVALDSKTYFEGLVVRQDGRPAAHAKILANQGPKQVGPGYKINSLWTDTTTDDNGRYRLHVYPDEFEFLVRAPGVGATRVTKISIFHGESRKLNFKLEPAIQLRALTVDSRSGQPVPGVRLHNWEQKDFDGRSNAEGRLLIDDMMPGAMDFHVEAEGYARWWSPEAIRPWGRFEPEAGRPWNWQSNFDSLEFDARANMQPVTITLEKGVRLTGRVLDPDGMPVGGATVAPALTGSGNSLTGDTRFSVESKADGSFVMLLPASGKAKYNLVVHDGKCEEWRNWANGVLPPFQTTPGQEIKDVTIQLTRPATVRGKVVDANNKPVAGREVRASASDGLENRYYLPTTKTKADGTFELRFVRAGKQHIQVDRFSPDQPLEGTSKTVQLKEGHTLDDVKLIAAEKK